MGEPLIEVESLSYVVGEGTCHAVTILRDVDFRLEAGEFVAVMGANGSGKSTLVRHLNGLLLPTRGRVRVEGLDTSSAEHLWEIRQRVGMVFQNPDHQMVSPVVEEEVAFGLENLCLPTEEIRARVEWALVQVGLQGSRLANPGHLSGGQKQRLAIASILAMQPRVLVLDEPTAMLDPTARGEVLRAVRETRTKQGIGVVLVTHSVEEAQMADRVVVLDGGRVVADAPSSEILGDGRRVEALRLELPLLMQLARLLAAGGLELGCAPATCPEMALAIQQAWDGGRSSAVRPGGG